MHIRKGDKVKILKGKDRGKIGNVLFVLTRKEKATVDGLNVYKKRVRPKKQGEKGEVVLLPRPIFAANLALICDNCKKSTRAGFRKEGAEKIRYCKKCKAIT